MRLVIAAALRSCLSLRTNTAYSNWSWGSLFHSLNATNRVIVFNRVVSPINRKRDIGRFHFPRRCFQFVHSFFCLTGSLGDFFDHRKNFLFAFWCTAVCGEERKYVSKSQTMVIFCCKINCTISYHSSILISCFRLTVLYLFVASWSLDV